MLLTIGGFACGFAAGAAALHGRLCTMSAIEDAVLGGDYRAAKAWGLALAIAIVATAAIGQLLAIDFAASVYARNPLDLATTLLGGLLFGFGMALVGTCSFGLLVRAGSGDLRALISATVVGIAAFAFTAGLLAPLRMATGGLAPYDLDRIGGPLLPGIVAQQTGWDATTSVLAAVAAVVLMLASAAAIDQRMRSRPRLLLAALVMGASVACGWAVTGIAIERMESTRLESLSFVAPAGRLLMQIMSDTLRGVGFGVASVLGVVCGAAVVAVTKDQVRWEAFDDVREMRRHLAGAVMMGIGGVMAGGCTVGQGMSAASSLAVSAPIVVIGMIVGARIGLAAVLEGHALWRMGGRR